jgi:hypothetical protein
MAKGIPHGEWDPEGWMAKGIPHGEWDPEGWMAKGIPHGEWDPEGWMAKGIPHGEWDPEGWMAKGIPHRVHPISHKNSPPRPFPPILLSSIEPTDPCLSGQLCRFQRILSNFSDFRQFS